MRSRRLNRARFAAALAAASFAGALSFACSAFARPGGGDEYGGGSLPSFSTGDGGGDGGGGDVDIGLVIQLIYLCFEHPPLGITGLVLVGGFYYAKARLRRGTNSWSTSLPAPVRAPAAPRAQGLRAKLTSVRSFDPAFSLILFEDFVYALYAEVQVSRARGGIGRLAAFLNPEVGRALYDTSLERVDGVVIGALRYNAVEIDLQRVVVTLDVEANLSEVRPAGGQRFYVKDRVKLARLRAARSRPPARVRKLDCPNCGAPLEGMRGTTCAYCRTEVGGGRLDWVIESIQRLATEGRPPFAAGDVAERGNELATVVSPGCEQRLEEFGRRDPAHSAAALKARIGLIFAELQAGWSNRDLARIRPFVSDNLFQYFGFSLDAYAANGARNVTENARILDIVLAEFTSDSTYDAVTVRVFATGLDYTLAGDGRILRGSRSKERPYTEYWTLVRGSAARGRPRAELVCPCCGAPLKIGMAGNCEYCSARVVSGEFDWVLSRIEQDEAYG